MEYIMILSVGGIKGGSGKTTLAINIAVYLSSKNKKVLLVDGDEQKSATSWAVKREQERNDENLTTIHLTGSSILSEVKKLSKNYDETIIDVGGRNNASLRASLVVCNTFLTPLRPRSLDIWTLQELEDLLNEAKATGSKFRTLSILNQADPVGKDNQDAMKVLSDYHSIETVEFPIIQRKIFSNSINDGLGVYEYSPKDKKAEKELSELISKIYI